MAIHVLPPEVAAKIAAGEVVERPASVVKELLENALDAGATHISIEIKGGGLDTIRVSDNGCGIAAEEMELAFARHATSKLTSADDLFRIRSLGFRGEALPSIAAVAQVEMVSRPLDAVAAAFLRLSDGRIVQGGSRGAPVGTSVSVRHLFAKQPARRKFLRSPASEAQHISTVVSHYALAYPEVRFALRLDADARSDRQALLSPGSGNLRDAVAAVYGAEVAADLLAVQANEGALSLGGLIGPPHISRASRSYITIFVNRRPVQNRRLTFAVEEAYQGLLMSGRHPIAVIDLRLPVEEVDVNVHPTKAEVRFRQESAVFAAIQRAVRATLLEGAPVPTAVTAIVSPDLSLSPQATTPPLWEHARALESRPRAQPAASAPPGLALPALRVIGQFGATYIVAEGPDGMYLIDQHAAHERVLYEAICQQRANQSVEVQGLLEPLMLEVPPRQEALMASQGEALAAYGFSLEPFGPPGRAGRAYLLRAVPALLADKDVRQAVLAFLDLMAEEGRDPRDPSTGSLAGQAGQDRVAMSLACHAAIRAGHTLSVEEMRELVRQLEAAQAPHTCPHGRPTMIQLSAETLAREFGRR